MQDLFENNLQQFYEPNSEGVGLFREQVQRASKRLLSPDPTSKPYALNRRAIVVLAFSNFLCPDARVRVLTGHKFQPRYPHPTVSILHRKPKAPTPEARYTAFSYRGLEKTKGSCVAITGQSCEEGKMSSMQFLCF